MTFAHVTTWFFDLDDTLYPRSSGLFDQTRANILAYLTRHFGVDESQAQAIRRRLVEAHGTTLRGLVVEEGIDPHEFIRFEDGLMDYTCLAPDRSLCDAIAALPGRKVVFTNASLPHARSVLTARGLMDCFEDTFDLIAADFLPKPHRATYEAALARAGAEPHTSAMIDDKAVNLQVPRELGMTTLLVDEDRTDAVLEPDGDGGWVTGDLSAALTQMAPESGAAPVAGRQQKLTASPAECCGPQGTVPHADS